MLGATYLLALDKAFKLVRKNQKPFGGIQVIFTGDFFNYLLFKMDMHLNVMYGMS